MRTLIIGFVLLAGAATCAGAQVKVVASTTDLAAIAQYVGGDLVDVTSIANGQQDPHYIEVLPSYMIRVKRAQLYLEVGLGLDLWAQRIIDGSRNGSLSVVDCSAGIPTLGVPTGKVDASMGDIHPDGNPHYWLNPENGLIIAQTIADALSAIDPSNATSYVSGVERFGTDLESHQTGWRKRAEQLAGTEIIAYHDTWPYFADAFGLDVAAFIEPKPGIEPSASHTAAIIEIVAARNIRMICMEPYFSKRTPESISRQTGARLIILPPSVGGADGADDYFSLFDTLLERLAGEQ